MRLTEEEKKANKAAYNKKYNKANQLERAAKNKAYKEANKEQIAAYREDNKERWREDNKEKIAAYYKEYSKANKEKIASRREANKEKIDSQQKKWREDNKEKIAAYYKEYNKANRKERTAQQNVYRKEKRKSDPLFRLIWNLRGSVRRYLKGGKNKKTQEILGMSFENFQLYLEVDYTEGMELDHVVPVSWATTDDEVYCLNHFSNFQVLTAEENMDKGNRFVKQNNLERTLEFHNNTELLSKIIERNLDRIN